MADEYKDRNGEGNPEEEQAADQQFAGDSGLGNLPPLSDFDSASGLNSDSGLPPLSSFDDEASSGGEGLPAISDSDLETPQPIGSGRPPGQQDLSFESASADRFSSGGQAPARGGFQDLAADSDFSPETPEIGPGPEQEDTPMLDSAFGGGDFDTGVDTPAPTQAMETPMFGGAQAPGGLGGFDQDAFGGGGAGGGGDFGGGADFGGGGFGGGTPPPDFSPDTNLMGGRSARMDMPPTVPEPEGRGGGRGGMLTGFALGAVLFAIIGILAGPYLLPSVPVVPDMLPANPYQTQITTLEGQNTQLNQRNSTLEEQLRQALQVQQTGQEGVTISPEEADRLRGEIIAKRTELDQVSAELSTKQQDLNVVREDLADLNAQYLEARDGYEDLRSETAIIQAQQRGLVKEMERLNTLVGGLEEANKRRVATKDALAFAIDRLFVQVRESNPLVPPRYDLDARLAGIERLREELQQSNFVTPELQQQYTELFLSELERSANQQYFYARLIVSDRYGAKYAKWAECLMKGNWAVYYRTLDGKNIGMYTNLGDIDTPRWGYREELPSSIQKQIEDEVVASRPEDYEAKLAVLAEKQTIVDDRTVWQKNFDAL
jgi:hypothetical protein